MNVKKVIAELSKKYPGERVIKNNEHQPTEILCEVDPASRHPSYSLAVAVIDRSDPHRHKRTEETYKVTKGKLTLYVDGKANKLSENEEFIIEPGSIHWAEGDETWVECYPEPGWTFADHILEYLQ